MEDGAQGHGCQGEPIMTQCIPIAVIGNVHAIQGSPRSWDVVRAEAVEIERLGPWGDCPLTLYVVEPGTHHYLVEDGPR
jgi:hypothetical protein